MTTRPVVFVDTNSIDNKGSATAFLGGRVDLEKIAKRADIKLPKVVYDEIHKHVRTFLIGQKRSFKSNPHRHLLEISDETIDNVDHYALVDKLSQTESIKFEIVELDNKAGAYKEIYVHAIEGTPPFEPSGDKGFKDALIAKTIDQYVVKFPGSNVFLWTDDGRLKEYFADTPVQIINGYQDFDHAYSEDKIEDEALLNRIWDHFDEVGVELDKRRPPDDQWLNYEGDLVAFFKNNTNGDVLLLVDSVAREPISFMGESIPETIANLESVGSFQTAHSAIAEVDYIFSYCDLEDIKTIARILLSNEQIYGIGGDDDISQFAAKLFHALDENNEPGIAEEVKTRYDLKLLTKKQLAELPF